MGIELHECFFFTEVQLHKGLVKWVFSCTEVHPHRVQLLWVQLHCGSVAITIRVVAVVVARKYCLFGPFIIPLSFPGSFKLIYSVISEYALLTTRTHKTRVLI